jgi:hypothetical protein
MEINIENFTQKINEALKEVKIKKQKDFKQLVKELHKESESVNYWLDCLFPVFKAWKVFLSLDNNNVDKLEDIMRLDPFFENLNFNRVSFDRDNKTIKAHQDGITYLIYEKENEMFIEIDE